jgi:hypothetical protein
VNDTAKSESKVKTVAQWAVSRADSVLALLLAGVFGVLGITGGAGDDAVRAATLAVLALVALTLVRLRSAREETERHVESIGKSLGATQNSIDALQDAVAAIEGGEPWRVVDCALEWDIQSRELAKFTKWRRLRFYRNEVLALHDWFAGDGESRNEAVKPGTFVEEPKQKIGEKEYSLILLPHPYKRGETQDFTLTREILNGFPNDEDEQVAIEVLEETEHATISVVWPPDKPPTEVRLQGKRVEAKTIPGDDVPLLADGRRRYSHELIRPNLGDTLTLFWDW